MPFSKLGLSEKVLAAVKAAGYPAPTPIQDQAIPHVLARRDVLGIAQTGTGKTAAFVLPMLTMLEHGRARARMPRTLILEPTRELAAQVEDHFDKYGVNHKLNVALIIGGVSFDDQDTKLTRGVDVLIATPGRLLDHFERGRLLLTGLELLADQPREQVVAAAGGKTDDHADRLVGVVRILRPARLRRHRRQNQRRECGARQCSSKSVHECPPCRVFRPRGISPTGGRRQRRTAY